MARPALLIALALVWTSVTDAKVSFNREIRPILSEQCFSCHGQLKQGIRTVSGELRKDWAESLWQIHTRLLEKFGRW